MSKAGVGSVRRIMVQEPAVPAGRYDYADAFLIDLPAPDSTPPRTWLGAALTRIPPVVVWIVTRLGFQPGTGDPLDGWLVRA